jgi:hypothetical protein
MTNDVYLFQSATQPKDVTLRQIPPIPPIPTELNLTTFIRHIKMYAIISRNGEVVGYVTSHTPFGVERPIQTS